MAVANVVLDERRVTQCGVAIPAAAMRPHDERVAGIDNVNAFRIERRSILHLELRPHAVTAAK